MGDHALERDEQAAATDAHEPRHRLRHLHPREALVAGVRVAHEHPEREGERRDVRERLPRADGERREHRVDLALVPRGELSQLLAGAVLDPADDDALLLEPGSELTCPEAGLRRAELVARARTSSRVSSGVRPSGDRTGSSEEAWPSSPATRTMKNSSRFDEKIEQNLIRSSNGTDESAARSRTRPLKSSQESSRLMYRVAASCVCVCGTT